MPHTYLIDSTATKETTTTGTNVQTTSTTSTTSSVSTQKLPGSTETLATTPVITGTGTHVSFNLNDGVRRDVSDSKAQRTLENEQYSKILADINATMPEMDTQHQVTLAMEQFKRYYTQKSKTTSQPQQQ